MPASLGERTRFHGGADYISSASYARRGQLTPRTASSADRRLVDVPTETQRQHRSLACRTRHSAWLRIASESMGGNYDVITGNCNWHANNKQKYSPRSRLAADTTNKHQGTKGHQGSATQQQRDTKERPLMIGIRIPNAKIMNGHRHSTARPHGCVPKKAASGVQ